MTSGVSGATEAGARMVGKICVVTGASTGIGKATAAGLARQGATVVIVCRDAGRGEAARTEIARQSAGGAVELVLADLSSMASVRALADELARRHDRLHALVNNAGVSLTRRTVTAEGIETTFAVNHLASFLLTNLLLDRLRAGAPARVVNVASAAHSKSIDFDNLQGEKEYSTFRIYGASKLMNMLFTSELSRRLEGSGVTANSVHPGVVGTELDRDYSGALRMVFKVARLFMITPEKGAEGPVHLASAPELEGTTGQYFERKKPGRPAPIALDAGAARRLWEISAELAGLVGGSPLST